MEKGNETNYNDYEKRASFLRKIKYLTVAVLVLVFLFFLVGYREDITVENIRYLLKYVDISPAPIGSKEAQEIALDTESDATLELFRSDLVVLSKHELKTYDMSSREGISASVSLTTPTISAGSKYFAIYDLGENYFALYNSFSKIYEETTSYPIWDVVVSNDGDFALITAEEGYRSALKVYNSNFENKMNWYTADKYIVGVDLFGKRDRYIAACCVENSENGDFLSSLNILKDGSDKIEAYVEIPSELCLEVKFFDNGNVCVLTDTALRVYDLKGKELEKIKFNSESLRMLDVGEEYAALVLNENSVGTVHRMIIVSEDGNNVMDTFVNSDIRDLCVEKDSALLLGAQTLISVDIPREKISEHSADKSYSKILALSEDRVILVYDKTAYVVSIK